MAGVVVAMMISTMHEKSCIDSHYARKFEKKFQNSVIHISRNHNDEIAEVSQSFLMLSLLYDAIIQDVITYKIPPEFLF